MAARLGSADPKSGRIQNSDVVKTEPDPLASLPSRLHRLYPHYFSLRGVGHEYVLGSPAYLSTRGNPPHLPAFRAASTSARRRGYGHAPTVRSRRQAWLAPALRGGLCSLYSHRNCGRSDLCCAPRLRAGGQAVACFQRAMHPIHTGRFAAACRVESAPARSLAWSTTPKAPVSPLSRYCQTALHCQCAHPIPAIRILERPPRKSVGYAQRSAALTAWQRSKYRL